MESILNLHRGGWITKESDMKHLSWYSKEFIRFAATRNWPIDQVQQFMGLYHIHVSCFIIRHTAKSFNLDFNPPAKRQWISRGIDRRVKFSSTYQPRWSKKQRISKQNINQQDD